jgi:hypothetical protein
MNIIERYCGYRAAHYDPNFVIQIKHALDIGDIQGLVVRYSKDMSSESTDWLGEFSNLKILGLAGFSSALNLSGLKRLEKLEQLLIDTQNAPPVIDFSWFPTLKSVSLDWKQGVFRNVHLANIEELRLWKYGGKDLGYLKQFLNISQLFLCQAKCCSLNQISEFNNLTSLEINYMGKLSDLSDLNLLSLKELVIENSKKISDYSPIAQCVNLEKLYIHHSASIESLDFISSLKKLKSFRFIGTNVSDGKLNPLFSVPDVCFTQKKHFSHKLSDFG